MRVAPPVQALSCSAGPWQSIQQALYALSAGVLVFWLGGHLFDAHAAWLPVSLACALAAGGAARRYIAPAPKTLIWDAAAWWVETQGGERQSGQVMLMLDLGGWMLVRFSRADAAWARDRTWLALRRADAGAAWPALRVALYAQQVGETSRGVSDPARALRGAA